MVRPGFRVHHVYADATKSVVCDKHNFLEPITLLVLLAYVWNHLISNAVLLCINCSRQINVVQWSSQSYAERQACL